MDLDYLERRLQFKQILKVEAMESQPQTDEVAQTPAPDNALQQVSVDDTFSIDLTNKKQDLSQLDMLDAQSNKIFSKTATNGLLNVENGMNSFNQDGQIIVSNMLDSQTSSPTMRNDLVEQIASFGATKTPNTGNSQHRQEQQQQVSGINSHQQVLATSGPGHLKSQSTSNTNYFSNNQTSAMRQDQLANSQGRSTDSWMRKQVGDHQHLEGNQKGTKSAVLSSNQQSSKQEVREIRKIPSKKAVTGKKKRIHRPEHAGDHPFPSESDMNNPKMMSAKHKPRHSSHTNRIAGVPGSYEAASNTMHQTPMTSQHQAMYQPPPMPTGDQYHGFSFITPIQQTPFSFQGMPAGLTQQQQQHLMSTPQMGFAIQQQPQVHFIAKQQKFYGISPERAPLVFKQSSQDKRPYTSSGHVLSKRVSKQTQQQKAQDNTNAIAALYLGSKTHQNGFGIGQNNQHRNQSQPMVDDHLYRNSQLVHQNNNQAAYSMQQIPHKGCYQTATGGKKNQVPVGQSNSAHVYRKDSKQVGGAGATFNGMGPNVKMPEQLQDEVLKLKQTANTHKEENIKLKTKIKILENEMGRKERTLEDFLQQNQFIQNAQKNGNAGTLAPIVQTAQRYQAETFLVMSLKKQVKEQKAELIKVQDELASAKRNIKNTKFFEMDQELKLYRDELIRLRYLLEQAYQNNQNMTLGIDTCRQSSMPQNQSQPSIMGQNGGMNNGTHFKVQSNSQSNFFAGTNDATSNLSHHIGGTASQQHNKNNQLTLSNDDQNSNDGTSEPASNSLPPLKCPTSNGQTTPIGNPNHFMQPQLSTDQQQQLSLSVADTKENEVMKQLTMQLSERDGFIRQLQHQLDESMATRQRMVRAQNMVEGKSNSAGPSVKSELSKIKKQMREKDKEISRLKGEQNVQASSKSLADEEAEKKVKQLSSQLSQLQKQTKDSKAEFRKRDERNEQLSQELAQATEQNKQQSEKQKKELSLAQSKLSTQVEKLSKQADEKANEHKKMIQELEQSRKQVQELKSSKQTNKTESSAPAPVTTPVTTAAPTPETAPAGERFEVLKVQKGDSLELDAKIDGELGLIATVLGCRENRDRIEFSYDLKEYVEREDGKINDKEERKYLGLASDYTLKLSKELKVFINKTAAAELARQMPKYEFISPSLALIIMNEIRRLLMEPDLIDILNEKDQELKLPFDALRDLCARFDKILNDEHCAFITASYLTEIDEAIIYINFREFLADVKDPRGKELDITSSRYRATSSIGSEGSDSDIKRITRARENSPLSEILNRSAGKGALSRMRKSVDEEHMLDVAEAIFLKMADLLTEKGRTIRGVFTKYAEPELFPDRTVLELLSPPAFLQGIKEVGIDDLQEFEVACLMRVLAKPELDSAVILNEFIMIMENFGVMDQDDDFEDYIPDTEQSVQSVIQDEEVPVKEEKKENEPEENTAAKAGQSAKKKPRTHDLNNVDAKGQKIMRKLARFLLKQFLHPREFFGKAITKQHIKTKKREFYLDTLTFKEFYLRIKIANVRKRLTENQSLNKEICLDLKIHKEIINVKLLVKALEEVAEEEQKVLIQEEREMSDKLELKIDEVKQALGVGEVDTPRSESADLKIELGSEDSKKDLDVDEDDKKSEENAKETYGIDSMKFGNSSIRGKSASQSPMLGERGFVQLNTIEEERHETQTSQYMESASEVENSKLLSSSNMRNSANMVGFEFDEDFKPKLMTREATSSACQIVNVPGNGKAATIVDSELENARNENQGRLTGRGNFTKENLTSQSMNETSLNQFMNEAVVQSDAKTPLLPVADKALDISMSSAAPVITEDINNQAT